MSRAKLAKNINYADILHLASVATEAIGRTYKVDCFLYSSGKPDYYRGPAEIEFFEEEKEYRISSSGAYFGARTIARFYRYEGSDCIQEDYEASVISIRNPI